MLFCIVTFNLWLHYSKLLTYLYLLLLCPVCTAFSFFPVLFYNYCCLVRINKWIDGWITKWLQLVADNNFETLGCSWLKNLCKWHCKPWSIDCWSVVTILQQMHSTCIFYNILLLCFIGWIFVGRNLRCHWRILNVLSTWCRRNMDTTVHSSSLSIKVLAVYLCLHWTIFILLMILTCQ